MKRYVIFPLFSVKLKYYELEKLKKNNLEIIGLMGKNTYSILNCKEKEFFDEIHFIKTNKFSESVQIMDFSALLKEMSNIIKKYQKDCNCFSSQGSTESSNIILYYDFDKTLELFYVNFEKFFGKHKVEYFYDKFAMRDFFKNNKDIRGPKFKTLDHYFFNNDLDKLFLEIKQEIGLPFILKPTNLSGCMSICKVMDLEQFKKFIKSDIIPGYGKFENYVYLAEEFIDGGLFQIDAVVYNGKIKFLSCSKYHFPCLVSATLKENLGVIMLSKRDSDFIKLKEYTVKTIESLNCFNTVVHLELFKNKKNDLVFLEIGARPGGAYTKDIIQKKYNFNLFHAHFYALTDQMEALKVRENNYTVASIIPQIKKAGKIVQLNAPGTKSKYDIEWEEKIGNNVVVHNDITASLCQMVLYSENKNDIINDINMLNSFEFADIES